MEEERRGERVDIRSEETWLHYIKGRRVEVREKKKRMER